MSLPVQVFILGLLTVFLVLLVVVGTGNAIIWIVNHYFPTSGEGSSTIKPTAVKATHLAAITAAVQTVTRGKGKVEKIEKMP